MAIRRSSRMSDTAIHQETGIRKSDVDVRSFNVEPRRLEIRSTSSPSDKSGEALSEVVVAVRYEATAEALTREEVSRISREHGSTVAGFRQSILWLDTKAEAS